MTRYRRLRLLAVAGLLLELVVGLGGLLTPRTEIFPFASWFLFPLVPGKTSDYDLILRTIGNRPITPPRRFGDGAELVRTPHSIVTYQIIQQLGRAVEAHDPRANLLRRDLEGHFTVPDIHYDLVKTTFQPVERWQSGRSLTAVPLRSFVAGQP